MSQHATPTEYDGFEVVRTAKSPGMVAHERNDSVVLHNADKPCGAVTTIINPVTLRLGADHSPRPELYRFCNNCPWPADRATLRRTLLTTPERFR